MYQSHPSSMNEPTRDQTEWEEAQDIFPEESHQENLTELSIFEESDGDSDVFSETEISWMDRRNFTVRDSKDRIPWREIMSLGRENKNEEKDLGKEIEKDLSKLLDPSEIKTFISNTQNFSDFSTANSDDKSCLVENDDQISLDLGKRSFPKFENSVISVKSLNLDKKVLKEQKKDRKLRTEQEMKNNSVSIGKSVKNGNSKRKSKRSKKVKTQKLKKVKTSVDTKSVSTKSESLSNRQSQRNLNKFQRIEDFQTRTKKDLEILCQSEIITCSEIQIGKLEFELESELMMHQFYTSKDPKFDIDCSNNPAKAAIGRMLINFINFLGDGKIKKSKKGKHNVEIEKSKFDESRQTAVFIVNNLNPGRDSFRKKLVKMFHNKVLSKDREILSLKARHLIWLEQNENERYQMYQKNTNKLKNDLQFDAILRSHPGYEEKRGEIGRIFAEAMGIEDYSKPGGKAFQMKNINNQIYRLLNDCPIYSEKFRRFLDSDAVLEAKNKNSEKWVTKLGKIFRDSGSDLKTMLRRISEGKVKFNADICPDYLMRVITTELLNDLEKEDCGNVEPKRKM